MSKWPRNSLPAPACIAALPMMVVHWPSPSAALGLGLGILGAALNLWAMRNMIWLLGRYMEPEVGTNTTEEPPYLLQDSRTFPNKGEELAGNGQEHLGRPGGPQIDAQESSTVDIQRARMGTFFIVVIFFLKLPIFIALANFTRQLGGQALTCFLLGVGLVYSALVGWALARR